MSSPSLLVPDFSSPRHLSPWRYALALATCLILTALSAVPAEAAGRLSDHGPDPARNAGAAARSASAPAPWCGVASAADQVSGELDNGAFRYHAIYAVPSDGADRFGEVASRIQADARGASALLERLYGRAIRFDMGTSCGPRNLDISVVRLSLSAEGLRAAAAQGGFARAVSAELRAAGFPTLGDDSTAESAAGLKRNYVVWLDGPSPDGCGEAVFTPDARRDPAQNANQLGGKVAVVFRSGSGFCGADVVRHEIGHTLGAVPAGAPNLTPGSHCGDAAEDTMCTSGPQTGELLGAKTFFDYGNDDYWDPPGGAPLPWWTVNLSRFLCPDAGCNGVSAPASADDSEAVPTGEEIGSSRPVSPRRPAKRRRTAKRRKSDRTRRHGARRAGAKRPGAGRRAGAKRAGAGRRSATRRSARA